MAKHYPPPIRRSRVEQHSKRKKTNFILNILIGIVLLAILVVGGNMLFGDDGNSRQTTGNEQNENENQKPVDEDEENTDEPVEKPEDEDSDDGSTEDEPTDSDNETGTDGEGNTGEEAEDPVSDEEEVIVEESNDPNVIQVVVNPAWKPVGTVQAGEHVTQYDDGTPDRQEMEKALAYAVDSSEDNMIVWWLQRGEVPNKHVIGTIETKHDQKLYMVYLEWTDGQGWKPTKYEEIKETDKDNR